MSHQTISDAKGLTYDAAKDYLSVVSEFNPEIVPYLKANQPIPVSVMPKRHRESLDIVLPLIYAVESGRLVTASERRVGVSA